MPGNLTVPNIFQNQSGSIPLSQLDVNFSTISNYVNPRQVTLDLLTNRPAAGVPGRWFCATDVSGGTLYVDTGSVWTQVAAGVLGAGATGGIDTALYLTGNQAGSYSTTSATYVDVDATNLKATVTVPAASKWLIVAASYSLTTGTAVTNGQACVQFLAAGTAVGPYSYCGGIVPTTVQTVFGVVANPTVGAQTVALQFRGDGVNATVMSNPTAEGYAATAVPVVVPRMLILVTT